jgi:hypothetical protein
MYIVKTIPLTHRERRRLMKAFIAGTVFGLVLATVGFSGIARMLDRGVDTVKTQSQELAK